MPAVTICSDFRAQKIKYTTVSPLFAFERLLLNEKTPGFLASNGEEFSLGPGMRIDCSELLCNKILLKYNKIEKQWKQWQFIFWAPKSLQMVTAAMKLKDTYSLEGKL